MRLLALDTSSEFCSVALLDQEEIIVRHERAPRKHADLVLPLLDAVLSEAGIVRSQLDAIAFGRGPGSFTGVRIAVAVTQGIAFSLDKPVVPVSTLAAVAQQMLDDTDASRVLTALDARMGEVYWAGWVKNADGFAENSIPETVLAPENVAMPSREKWVGAGSGWGVYGEVLSRQLGERLVEVQTDIVPHAATIARLGKWYFGQGTALPAEQALPVYLRDKVAEKKAG